MTKATWKIIDAGRVDLEAANEIGFDCPGCGREALLPVIGLAMAQMSKGIVFDIGHHEMPRTIQCRHCRRRFSLE